MQQAMEEVTAQTARWTTVAAAGLSGEINTFDSDEEEAGTAQGSSTSAMEADALAAQAAVSRLLRSATALEACAQACESKDTASDTNTEAGAEAGSTSATPHTPLLPLLTCSCPHLSTNSGKASASQHT